VVILSHLSDCIARTKMHLHQTDLEIIERSAIVRGLFSNQSVSITAMTN
jgi:hypothetical protein